MVDDVGLVCIYCANGFWQEKRGLQVQARKVLCYDRSNKHNRSSKLNLRSVKYEYMKKLFGLMSPVSRTDAVD